ncbi:MAG: N-acetylmuramoyl-L-alanine amidase [Rhodothalassiaceae bacterium]
MPVLEESRPVRLVLLSFFLMVALLAGLAPDAGAAPLVSAMRLGENGARTRFVIDIDKAVTPNVFTLADPLRLVIDLPAVEFATATQGSGDGRGVIARYRYGAFSNDVSRIVLDLTEPARLERSFTLPPSGNSGYRLVFDLIVTDEKSFIADIRKPVIAAPAETRRSVVNPSQTVRPAQRKRIVMIDAGHGGTDPGAPGAAGVPEKTITLGVARAVKARLDASGRYEAMLTRDRDIFIRLNERYEIARRHRADLFISLHADSFHDPKVRGATVYTLSEKASDAEAAALAARENKSDLLVGIDLAEEAPEVANILIELAQRESMNYSARFANYLLPQLRDRVTLRRNSHRFAGFIVLKAPDVPSVLLEMGYLSNREDARFLGSAAGQQKLAEAVLAATDAYFAALAREQN